MKKLIPILPILLILLLAACTPDIVQQGGTVVRSVVVHNSAEPVTVEADDLSGTGDTVSDDSLLSRGGDSSSGLEDSSYSDEDIVYATKTGKKYHKDGCSHLSKSKIPISLDQALQQGLTPCSICYPAT